MSHADFNAHRVSKAIEKALEFWADKGLSGIYAGDKIGQLTKLQALTSTVLKYGASDFEVSISADDMQLIERFMGAADQG